MIYQQPFGKVEKFNFSYILYTGENFMNSVEKLNMWQIKSTICID